MISKLPRGEKETEEELRQRQVTRGGHKTTVNRRSQAELEEIMKHDDWHNANEAEGDKTDTPINNKIRLGMEMPGAVLDLHHSSLGRNVNKWETILKASEQAHHNALCIPLLLLSVACTSSDLPHTQGIINL